MTPYLLESDLVADCKKAAEAMNVYVEFAGQRKAKGSGSTRGLPDAFLYAGGKCLPIEMKRPKQTDTRQGRCSLDQIVAAERRRKCGVETYVIDTLVERYAFALPDMQEAAVDALGWYRLLR